jgi:ABC-type transport system involved in multi-copper enzyme maturation permease subunit
MEQVQGIIFFVMIFLAIIGIILLIFGFVSLKKTKKILAVILMIFGLLFFVSSAFIMIFGIFAFRSTGNIAVPSPAVSIIIQNVSPNGISFHFENKTENSYTYGEDYVLYVREGNDWRIVEPIIEKWGFTAIGYTLEPKSITDTITINWQWLFGQLPLGEYKIQKAVLFIREPGDYDRFVVDQYFTIAHD